MVVRKESSVRDFPHIAAELCHGSAQHLPTIQGIRTISLADETRVVISLSAPIAYELIPDPSASPSRLYIRFSPASLAPGARTTAKVDDGLLKEVRTGLVADSIIRVSLEVERLGTYRATAFRSPDQVVIQLRKQPEMRIAARPPVRPEVMRRHPHHLKIQEEVDHIDLTTFCASTPLTSTTKQAGRTSGSDYSTTFCASTPLTSTTKQAGRTSGSDYSTSPDPYPPTSSNPGATYRTVRT